MFKWYGWLNFTPYTKVEDFANYLRGGYIMGSKCKKCGTRSFPPRADCPECMHGEFEWVEYSGKGKLHTYTRIEAAPTGFDKKAPYTVGLIDLEEGGRLVAWLGESVKEDDIKVGMELQAVPRVFEETPDIRVYLSLEKPGTKWQKMPVQDTK